MRMFSSTRPTATSSNSKRSLLRKSRTRLIAITSLTAMAVMIFASTSFATRSLTQSWFENVASLIKGGTTSLSTPAHANESMSLESPLSPLPAMATERRGHTATRLADGRVLIAGGESASGALNETEIYDPTSATFSVSGNMSTARVDHSATLLADGRVLIAGGRNGAGSIPTTELFDPTTGTFSSGPVMSVARAGHSATLFADGRILIVGGDATGSAEVFDAAANTFTALDSHLTDPRSMHSAALLLDGRVVVVGGRNSAGEDLKSVEIFDTPASTFSTVDDSLTVGRSRALLRVLFDGKVQIIGGNNDGSMEIYDPISESIGAYAHVLPQTDTCTGLKPGVMASQTRAALFHNGQTDALLDRSGHTITEINGQALIVGGANSSGAILSSTEVLTSYSASITTDKLDYAPGETATFTGRGFLAGETVRIVIHEDPHTPQERSIQVVADADGNISGGYLVQEYDLRLQFIASAKGLTSGITAQTTFTDDTNITTATIATRESTCTTNTTSFTQGQTICGNAVITGVGGGGGAGSFFIVWFNPSNVAVKTTTNTVPATTPTTFNDTLTTNGTSPTGTWSVHVCKNAACSGGNDVVSASFTLAAPATNSVTFDATPIADVPAATTVLSVTIGAGSPTAVTRGELPKTFTGISSGTNVAYSYVSPITQSATKQYRWLSTTGPVTTQSGNFTLSSNTNVSATYQAQFLQTFTHSGLTADATGTVVTVDAAAKTFTDLAFTKFVDSGATVTYSYNDPVTSSVTGKQYRRSSVTGPASGYTVAGANTITGNYVAQYKLTLAVTAGVPAGTTNITGGTNNTFYDDGTVLNLTATTPVADGPGKRWRFDNWTGDVPSPPNANNPVSVTMSAARSVTANYVAQYQLTLAVTAGVPSGTTNITGGTSGTFYDSGTVLNLTATSPVADGPGKQWRFDNWTGDVPTPPNTSNPVAVTMDVARSITANYVAQYQLTLAVTAGVPGGLGNITGGTSGNFYDSGTVLNLTAASPVADGPTKQWRFDNWTGDVTSPPNTSNPVSVTMNQARSITANYVAQYLQTFTHSGLLADATGTVVSVDSVNKSFGDLPFTKYVDDGATVTYTFNNPVTSSITGKRYRLDSVSGPTTGYTVSGASTVTGNYVTQYQLSLFITAGVPTGLANITGGSDGTFYDSGTNLNLSAATPVTETATKRWRFDNWTGDVTTPPNTSNPVAVSMNQPRSITANYVAQYLQTFNHSGLTSDATNTVVTVDGDAQEFGDLPISKFVDQGATVSYTFTNPVTSNVTDKQYRLDSVTGPASGYSVSAANTVVGNYVAQFAQHFKQTGLTSDATLTVVTVDGSDKTYADLEFTKYVDAGATVTYSYNDPVASTVTGKRYRRTSVTGPASGYTVSGANTITGNYVAQYQLTLAITAGVPGGLSNISGGTNGTYYDDGTNLNLTAASPVVETATKRWRFTNWTGDVSGSPNSANPVAVTMDQARSITANYVIQWLLTFAQTGIGSDTGANTVVTVSGNAKAKGVLPYTEWFDDGSNVSYSYETNVDTSPASTKRYRRDSVSGIASGTAVTAASTITGNYVTQWQLTFAQSGIGGDTGTNTVATVGASTKQASDLPYTEWFDNGATVNYSYEAFVNSSSSTKRYKRTSVSGIPTGTSVTAASTVTGNYVVQWQLTFTATGLPIGVSSATGANTVVTVGGNAKTAANLPFSDWYDNGTSLAYVYSTPVSTDPVSSTQYELTNGGSLPSSPINVTSAQTITGNYSVNNYTIHYLTPIDESTLSTYRLNTGKNGRVIPVKVQIYKNGVPVETGTVLMRVMGSNCAADDGNSLVEEYADAGNSNGNTNLFRWNAGTPGFWIYNLDTKALGLATNNCYRLDVYLNSYTGPTAIKLSTSIFALFKPVK